MKFEIKNRWDGTVQFSCELTAEIGEASYAVQLGFAVKKAVTEKANLTRANLDGANLDGANLDGANLDGANLYGANLYGANLTRANLTRANLTRANLDGANLDGANLDGANLYGANLTRANLTRANLTRANLTRANLTRANLYGANLDGANLDGANLYGANLYGANLYGANLYGANLTRANLYGAENIPLPYYTRARDDLWAVLSAQPREVPGLRTAISEGRVDGSTYQGDCACLVGTLANIAHLPHDGLEFVKPNASRPAEQFFMQIKPGDTPETNPSSKMALEWVDSWLGRMREAFGVVS